jgi:hypothetical protein
MLDILRLLAGPRFCPWCLPARETFGDRVTDRLPGRVVIALGRYDRLVGTIAIPLHARLHGEA